MTIDQGDNGFAFLLYNLRRQISLLKERCTAAEAEVTALKEAHRRQGEQLRALEEEHRTLTEKYQSLQAGAPQGASANEIEPLRSRYLAMIREIDLCLDKLNG